MVGLEEWLGWGWTTAAACGPGVDALFMGGADISAGRQPNVKHDCSTHTLKNRAAARFAASPKPARTATAGSARLKPLPKVMS